MLRLVPPAGTPVTFADVLRVKLARIRGSLRTDFEAAVLNHSGAERVFFLGSGRAAQYMILKAFAALSDGSRDEVVIPAYTCYSVAASVARAGMKIRPIDIDPATLDYDYDQLKRADLSKVLAVNSSNLFGIVSDWSKINSLAIEHGFYTIDDAAQTFGSQTSGGQSGAQGDAGFYSLGRGKNLSAWSGGLLLTSNKKIAAELEGQCKLIREPGLGAEAVLFAKYLLSGLLLRPRLYWLPASIPSLHLGETVYDEEFEIEGLTGIQMAIGLVGLRKLESLNRQRATTAYAMAGPLIASGRYNVPGYDENRPVNYIRLPVLAEDRAARDRAIAKLRRIGVVASGMYPSSIPKIDQVRTVLADTPGSCPAAEQVVDRLFTLPTHPYVTKRDVERIIACLT